MQQPKEPSLMNTGFVSAIPAAAAVMSIIFGRLVDLNLTSAEVDSGAR